MQRYVVRRVGALAVTLFFVSLLVFVVVRVLPGDPALIILGLEANADSVARVRQALGLDQPVPVQYVQWVGHALRGDLGRSIQYDLPVGARILSRLNVTLPLTLLAAGFMIAAAIPLGVFAATRHRRWGDYLTMTLSQLGVAVPGFWAGLLLILLFSVRLGWVQSGGFDGWGEGSGAPYQAAAARDRAPSSSSGAGAHRPAVSRCSEGRRPRGPRASPSGWCSSATPSATPSSPS